MNDPASTHAAPRPAKTEKPLPDAGPPADTGPGPDFIRAIVADDLRTGKYGGRVATRFPPEPNGYLHIGHAKSICLNFGIALENGGTCNLRFDDTNPTKEDVEYVDSIMEDVRWLGFDWEDRLYYASDYFQQLYDYAEALIRDGKAYVDSLSAEEISAYRGTLTEPGRESPYRSRSVEENLDLFRRMRAGEFADGAHVLRAKIDMASPNINLRDPNALPHPACASPSHGGRLVHLSDVRLCARRVRCDREDHPFDLHARVRGSPAALRLVPRRAQDSVAPAADRVCAAQDHAHGDEQAEAPAAGRGEACRRLGRSADAHPLRHAPPRLSAGGDPRLLRPTRGREAEQRGRYRPARAQRARRLEPARPAPDGGLAALARRARELPRGPGGDDGGGEQPGRRERRHPTGALLARPLHRARGFHGGSAAQVLSALPGQRGAAALCVSHQVPRT